ncbi:MAG: serine O-acetyltransferase [Pseudomonadales bacterium]
MEDFWQKIRQEAESGGEQEPALASFYFSSVLNHRNFAAALAFHLASRMGSDTLPALLLRSICDEAYVDQPELVQAAKDDLLAYYDRDPACDQYILPLLFFKGFLAIQAYRIAHRLWGAGRTSLALYFQSMTATVFSVDIHPAACLGTGLMVDHATGIVIGETARVGNNVSMLHGVSLGGSGCHMGQRHPMVADGVLLAAGAKILGPVSIGEGAKVAAGSVVLEDVDAHMTVAGVPAKPVGKASNQPAVDMNQSLD